MATVAFQVFLGATASLAGDGFTAPPEQLQRAAAEAPTADGTTWLLRSVRWSVDEKRNTRRVSRDVIVVRGQDAVDRWSTLSLGYAPEFEAPPVVRARVVTPDGRVFTLDPADVRDVVPKEDPTVVTDERSVRAALPGVRNGAVIELETTYVTTKPRFQSAQAARLFVLSSSVREVQVVLEHPRAVPLTVSTGGLVLTRRDEDSGNVHRVVLQGTDVARPKGTEARKGQVAWTTGGSWQAIARDYLAQLEAVQEASAPVDVAPLVKGAGSRAERAQRLLDWVHAEVRYTGADFGERTHVPWSPAEVVQRGFGDCKDMALLMVDLLRKAGIEARVALLDTDALLDAKTPALSFFDHAIVYVPATKTEPALWLDPTSVHTPAGLLPEGYAGEPALVVDRGTTGLISTWAPTSKDSERRVVVELDMPAFGSSSARVTQTLTGLFAAWARRGMESEGPEWLTIEARTLGKVLGGGPLTGVSQPSKAASEPVVYGGEVKGLDDWFTDWSFTELYVPEDVALRWVADELKNSDEEPELVDDAFVLAIPHTSSLVLRIRPPVGFSFQELPATQTQAFGPASLTRTLQSLPDGRLEVVSRFDTGPRRYTRAQVRAFREAYRPWSTRVLPALRLGFEGDALQKQNKVPELLAWYAKQRERHPDEVSLEARWAGTLLLLGLGDAAREKSRLVVEKYPDSALAWMARGWVLSYDVLGGSLEPGFDRAGALAALRRAQQLEPDCRYCLQRVSELERCDDDGGWLSPKVDAAKAKAAYAAAYPKDRSSAGWIDLMVFAGDWDALKGALSDPRDDKARMAALLASQMLDGAPVAVKRWSDRLTRDELEKAAVGVVSEHYAHGRVQEGLALAQLTDMKQDTQILEAVLKLRAGKVRLEPEPRAVWATYAALLGPDAVKRERALKEDLLALPGGATADDFAQALSWGMGLVSRNTRFPTPLILEFMQAGAKMKVDRAGEDGRRLTVTQSLVKAGLFLVREGGKWRVLAVTSPRDVANQALRLFDKGRTAEARTWLEWARDSWLEQKLEWYQSTEALVYSRPEDKRLHAAAMTPRAPLARKVLAAALEGASAEEQGAVLRLLTYGAGQAGEWDEASSWADQLQRVAPEAADSFSLRAWAHAGAGDVAGRAEACRQWLEARPTSAAAKRCAANAASLRKDHEGSLKLWRDVVMTPDASAEDFNSAAWRALFVAKPPPELTAWAQKAVAPKNASWGARHTQAVVLALNPKELPRTLDVLRGLGGQDVPTAVTLVPARIAHTLGLVDEARALYRRVASSARDDTAELARRWLEELDRTAPSR